MTIDNITVRDYFTLQDTSEYDVFFDVLNADNTLCGKHSNVSNLTFDEVEAIRGVLNAPTYDGLKDVFCHCFNIRGSMDISSENEFLDESIFSFFRANQYLTDYFKEITKREKNVLTEKPDEKALMVNANERLASVSHLLTKIRLAEQFSTTVDVVGGWKYNKVFTILVANKRSREVNKDYNEIT